MTRVFIALGSNIGDRTAHLEAARQALSRLPGTRLVKWSRVYETAPVGPVEQGDFLNAAAELETTLEPTELMAALSKIEAQSGRAPNDRRTHWGPRTLDLDLLFYAQRILNDESLQVPHPRLHERWFVLRPLADLDPAFIHPVLGKTVGELLSQVEQAGARGTAVSPATDKT